MLFAQIRGIPTVNGYSSWFPDGWALDEPQAPATRPPCATGRGATTSTAMCAGSSRGPGGWVRGAAGSNPTP